MVRRLAFSLVVLALAGFLFFPRACSEVERQPITVQADRITITNLTGAAWSDVDVWLNDHYRGQVRQLAVGQQLDIPIRRMVAGRGQYFDPAKQSPYGVEVVATRADGKPVRLVWGQGRRR